MTGRPLEDLGVLITRPRHQARDLEAAVEAAGGRPLVFPVLMIEPIAESERQAQLAELRVPDIVVFVSPNAVRHGIAYAGPASIAAIGPATRRAIEATGHSVDIVPAAGYDSEHLLAAPELRATAGKVVRIIRGRSGRELLADTLRERGAIVEYLAVYDRALPTPTSGEIEALETLWLAGGIDAVIVMSLESLDNLVALLPRDLCRALSRTRLVSPASRVIIDAQNRFPGIPTTLARSPRAGDLIEALADSAREPTGRIHE